MCEFTGYEIKGKNRMKNKIVEDWETEPELKFFTNQISLILGNATNLPQLSTASLNSSLDTLMVRNQLAPLRTDLVTSPK
jgi:hypothetical protein